MAEVRFDGVAALQRNITQLKSSLQKDTLDLAGKAIMSTRSKDYSVQSITRTAGTLRVALKLVPVQDVRGLGRVYLEPRSSANEAFYNPRTDKLTVSALRAGNVKDRAESILHEIGHRASMRDRKTTYIAFRKMTPRALRHLEIGLSRWRGQLSGDFRPYEAYTPEQRPGEMFADAYAMYLMDKPRLRQLAPGLVRMLDAQA